MNTAEWALIAGPSAAVILAAITAIGVLRALRHLAENGYKATFTGPSLKVEKQAPAMPKPPAPKLIVVSPGDAVVPAQRETADGSRM